MSATKVLDLAEKQGLLEPKVIADLRKQVAESRFVVTPEALAKVLVDHEHLTPFQARKLVASALGDPPSDPAPPRRAKSGPAVPDDLTLADDDSGGLERSLTAPPGGSPADDDVVLLEAVDAPQPAAPKQAPGPPAKPAFTPPKQPAPKAEVPKREGSKPSAPPPGPTEELIELEPVLGPAAPAPASTSKLKPPRWTKEPKTPPPPRTPTSVPVESLVELTPIGAPGGLTPLDSRQTAVLTPLPSAPAAHGAALAPAALSELAPLDPLGAEATGDSALLGGGPAAARKTRKNVWDSPLLLIGGGLLGLIIVAFVLLYMQLGRGSAAELLAKADEDYRSGSYASALVAYEKFLKGYADAPEAGFVRVRIGMAKLRQSSQEGKDPRAGLAAAKTILPEIEKEEKFSEARQELSTLLPDIADGFATQATDAKDAKSKEELVGLAGEAMELVNTPSYLPASLRKDREPRIAAILDKLKVAERSIQQDKDLVVALGKIDAAEKQGDAAAAYQVRNELLKTYPGLVANPDLIAAIRKVGDKERELVKVSSEPLAAATDDRDPQANRIVLAVREGPEPAASAAKIAYVPLEGAVYAVDVESGRILWRRHLGYETLIPPQAISREDGADALVSDARQHELLRLAAANGKVVWRLPIGQAFTSPLVAGDRIYVTTRDGRVLQIGAASGAAAAAADLPQPAAVPAAFVSRGSRLVQLGQHSTVFVLSADSLACNETYYLGHARGSILVPPVAVLDYVIVAESPADDHTLIHVLAPAGDDKRLAEIGQPFRLRGRVTSPMIAGGRRIAAVTDLGQIAVYEVDAANKEQPVRPVSGLEATERMPTQVHYTADPNRLWTASKRISLLEIQGSLQNLASRWSRHQDDTFVGGLHAFGDVLIHARRRPGRPGIILEGCRAGGGETLWTTQVAAPIAAIAPSSARKTADVVTLQGRVFSLSGEQLAGGIVDQAAFPLPQGSLGSILPEVAQSVDGNTLAWTESQAGGRVIAYDLSAGTPPLIAPPADAADRAAMGGVLWNASVLVPHTSGKVELLSMATGKPAALPFLPALSPDALPQWSRPAVLPDGSGFVISDGRQTIYRVAPKDQPQLHLAIAAEQSVEQPIRGSLAALGDTVYGLVHNESAVTLVAFDPQSLAQLAKWSLSGQPQFGPVVVGGRTYVATETDGLLCLGEGAKLLWQRPQAHGPLAGPPVAGAAGELLLLYQSGKLARIAADSGDELAVGEIGEPPGRAAALVGQQVLVSTSDGALVLVPLPQ